MTNLKNDLGAGVDVGLGLLFLFFGIGNLCLGSVLLLTIAKSDIWALLAGLLLGLIGVAAIISGSLGFLRKRMASLFGGISCGLFSAFCFYSTTTSDFPILCGGVGVFFLLSSGIFLIRYFLGNKKFVLFRSPSMAELKVKGDVIGLVKALRNSDREIVRAASQALVQLGGLAVDPLVDAIKRHGNKEEIFILKDIGAPSVELLILLLKDGNDDLRNQAAWALGQIRDSRAIEPLTVALKDKDAFVQSRAAESLSNLGWNPDLSEKGLDYYIARRAWTEIRRCGKLAIGPLSRLLKDSDADIRKSAAETLGAIGDAEAVEPLITLLRVQDSAIENAVLKEALSGAQILLDRGHLTDEEKLRFHQANNKAQAILIPRQAASEALGRIGEPAIDALSIALVDPRTNSGVREAVIAALALMDSEKSIGPLSSALKDPDGKVRNAAAQVLGKHKDPRAQEALKTLE